LDADYPENGVLIACRFTQHYVGEDNIQVMDLIGSMGHGRPFAIGNIIKYAARQGKKRGQERADILKILHEVDRMALPPCHCLFQFYVAKGRSLVSSISAPPTPLSACLSTSPPMRC
jgi:hypothetical protein